MSTDHGGQHPSLIRQDPPPDPCMCDCSFNECLNAGFNNAVLTVELIGVNRHGGLQAVSLRAIFLYQ